MTYHNAHAAIVILGILVTGGGILCITKRLAEWRAASKRKDEAFKKYMEGVWYV